MKIILKIERCITTENFLTSVYCDNGVITRLIDRRFNAYPNWFKKHIKATFFKSKFMKKNGETEILYYDCIFGKDVYDMKTTEIRITMTHNWTSPFKIMWIKRENNIPDSAEVKATYDNVHDITTLIFKWGDLE